VRLAERDAALQTAQQRADELVALLQSSEVERTAARQEAEVRLAERDAALQTAQQRTDEFAALVKSFEAERTAALAESEAEKVRSAAYAAELAELHTQLETARILLTDAEGSREQEEKAGQRLQKEIASLRSAAARAEERQRQESAARIMSLENEITTLRSELSAARDVGKAALAAIRTEVVRVPEMPRKAGRLRSILRQLRSSR
jgi:chromosome segregation ATPase